MRLDDFFAKLGKTNTRDLLWALPGDDERALAADSRWLEYLRSSGDRVAQQHALKHMRKQLPEGLAGKMWEATRRDRAEEALEHLRRNFGRYGDRNDDSFAAHQVATVYHPTSLPHEVVRQVHEDMRALPEYAKWAMEDPSRHHLLLTARPDLVQGEVMGALAAQDKFAHLAQKDSFGEEEARAVLRAWEKKPVFSYDTPWGALSAVPHKFATRDLVDFVHKRHDAARSAARSGPFRVLLERANGGDREAAAGLSSAFQSMFAAEAHSGDYWGRLSPVKSAALLVKAGYDPTPEDVAVALRSPHVGSSMWRAASIHDIGSGRVFEAIRDFAEAIVPHMSTEQLQEFADRGDTHAALAAQHARDPGFLSSLIDHPDFGPNVAFKTVVGNPHLSQDQVLDAIKHTKKFVWHPGALYERLWQGGHDGIRAVYPRLKEMGAHRIPELDEKLPPDLLQERFREAMSPDEPERSLEGLMCRPEAPTELIRHAAQRLGRFPGNTMERLGMEDPDFVHGQIGGSRVHVRVGSHRIRAARDAVSAAGGEVHPKQLSGDWKIGRGPNGNISAAKLQQHIDKMPATAYNITEGEWGQVDGDTKPYSEQRHNRKPSNVFQLNLTNDHIHQLKEAGVYDTFLRAYKLSEQSGHPVGPGGLGWVRWTGPEHDEHEVTIPVERRVVDCDACDGGEVDCGMCEGEGKEKCDTCSGHGHVDCESCSDDEERGCSDCNDGDVECSVCGGEGKIDCTYCDQGKDRCPECNGKGEVWAEEGPDWWDSLYSHVPNPKPGVFIDEIQSDFGQSFVKQTASQARAHAEQEAQHHNFTLCEGACSEYNNSGQVPDKAGNPTPCPACLGAGMKTPEQAAAAREAWIQAFVAKATDETNKHVSETDQAKITKIVFGGHKSSEVLAEAFLQHLDDRGLRGTPVHVHTTKTKAPLSWLETECKECRGAGQVVYVPSEGKVSCQKCGGTGKSKLPGHFQYTYDQLPKKMGMTSGKYGEFATETNHDMRGQEVHATEVRKRERLGKSQREKDTKQVASVAVVYRRGQVLVGERNDNGKITLPGGHLEPGEEPRAAARRELLEETGLDVPEGRFELLGTGRVDEHLVHSFRVDWTKQDAKWNDQPHGSDDPDEECSRWWWAEDDAFDSAEGRARLHSPRNVTLALLGWGGAAMREGLDLEPAEGLEKAARSEPEKPELLVQHNLSTAGLLHADKVGGLPAPSLAVSHQDFPLTGFGDVTLVGPPHMVDPKADPKVGVYGADIYSPRHPKTERTVNKGPLNKLWKELAPHAARHGYLLGPEDVATNVAERGAAASGQDSRLLRHVLGAAFLAAQGVNVPNMTRPVPRERVWTDHPSLQSYKDADLVRDESALRGMSEVVRAVLEEHYADKRPHVRSMMINSYFDKNGLLLSRHADAIQREARDVGKVEPDRFGMEDFVEEHLKPREDQFRAWATAKLQPLEGPTHIVTWSENTGNKRRTPYSVENALKVMLRGGKLRGQEGFDYGLGNVRAHGTPQFRSIDQIKRARPKLVPKAEFDRHRDEMDGRFGSLVKELAQHHRNVSPSDFHHSEMVANAIADSFKPRALHLGYHLKQYGYENLPEDTLRRAGQFARDLREMPTQYFEAKPRRVVQLREFRGAAVPHDAPQALLDALDRHGVPYERYQRGDDDSRAEIIRKLAHTHKLHLGEMELTKGHRKEVVAVGAFNRQGHLLMGRRRWNGNWVTPAGTVNPGEHHEAAAHRELREETGLTPTKLEYLGSGISGRRNELLVHAYRAEVDGEPDAGGDPDAEFADPHGEYGDVGHTMRWVDVSNGLPPDVHARMHVPPDKDVLLQKLGIGGVAKSYVGKSEPDEVERLLNHPDPAERRMALKLRGVGRHHLALALAHDDPAVRRDALAHPGCDAGLLLGFLASPGDLQDQIAALRRPEVGMEHLRALWAVYGGVK